MKAERLRKTIFAIIMASEDIPPQHVGKQIDEDIAELERLAEMGKALEWAKENYQASWVNIAEYPGGAFCCGFDIDYLVKLYNNFSSTMQGFECANMEPLGIIRIPSADNINVTFSFYEDDEESEEE